MIRMGRWIGALIVGAVAVHGQLVVPGADGSDGAFTFVGDAGNANVMTINLADAPTIALEAPNPNPNQGRGVYDSSKWAVVFRYTTVNVPAGKTLRFANHPSNPPVVWLVSGDVTIAGTVSLDGENSQGSNRAAIGGPGGFRGGRGAYGTTAGAPGMGPGGGNYGSGAGSFGTVGRSGRTTYSNPGLFPLIGGSGGGGNSDGNAGGAGGGAILIASTGTIAVNGSISSVGGFGTEYCCPNRFAGGSGGGIRLICNSYTQSASARLHAGAQANGGEGRIRVEANQNSGVIGGPPASIGLPGPTARIWPDATTPRLQFVSIDTLSIPADPRARFDFPAQDLQMNNTATVPLLMQASNVPLDWTVKVRFARVSGDAVEFTAAAQPGSTLENSTWIAQVTVPNGFSAVQARANAPGVLPLVAPPDEGAPQPPFGEQPNPEREPNSAQP